MYYRRDLWNYIMFPQIPSYSRFKIKRMPGTLRQGNNLIIIISWFSKWTLIDSLQRFGIKSTNCPSRNNTTKIFFPSSDQIPDVYHGKANSWYSPPVIKLPLISSSSRSIILFLFAFSLRLYFATYILKINTSLFILSLPHEDPKLKVSKPNMGSCTKVYFKVSNLQLGNISSLKQCFK